MYRNLISSLILVVWILTWVKLAAFEVWGIFMFAYLGVKFLDKHCLLNIMLALHFRTFVRRLLYCTSIWISPDWG